MKNEFPLELITGIDRIDAQHMELMARMQQLYESYLEGTNVKKVTETMQYLKIYVNEHFATEEKYMRDIDYPNTQMHVVSHRDFINDFCKLEEEFIKNGYSNDFNLDFSVKLIGWMKNHVMMEDKFLADFVKKCETCREKIAKY